MSDRIFPILHPFRVSTPACPLYVPWDLVEPHREQALRNHDQTLERLAERGGLSPIELRLVLEDKPFPRDWKNLDSEASRQAIRFIVERLEQRSDLLSRQALPYYRYSRSILLACSSLHSAAKSAYDLNLAELEDMASFLEFRRIHWDKSFESDYDRNVYGLIVSSLLEFRGLRSIMGTRKLSPAPGAP